MEGLDEVGSVVTGAAVARAVEPKHGEGQVDGSGACLNCGAPLIGPHCHRCGQAAQVHRSLTAWWHDFSHGVLHFDGKFWRTLPLLALKPGQLTRRYIDGERAKFVSPMALFLFSVFLMFAIFSAMGGPINIGADRAEIEREFAQEQAESRESLETLRSERARLVETGAPVAAIDARIAQVEEQLEREQRLFEEASDAIDSGAGTNDSLIEGDFGDAPTSMDWFNEAYKKAKQNPSLLFYKLQANAYKFSWALIPISVPFLWLLFPFSRRFRLYDHVVFVTYSIAFMSLGLIVLTLLTALGVSGPLTGLAVVLIPTLHMYKQLRGTYGLGRFGAIWRTALLLVFALLALILFGMLLLAMGVAA